MTKRVNRSLLIRVARSALALLGVAFANGTAEASVPTEPESLAIERLDQIRADLLDTYAESDGDEIAWDNWENWDNWDNWPNQWSNY